jgi:hypothetical protein
MNNSPITEENTNIEEYLNYLFGLIGTKRKTYSYKNPIIKRVMIFINLDNNLYVQKYEEPLLESIMYTSLNFVENVLIALKKKYILKYMNYQQSIRFIRIVEQYIFNTRTPNIMFISNFDIEKEINNNEQYKKYMKRLKIIIQLLKEKYNITEEDIIKDTPDYSNKKFKKVTKINVNNAKQLSAFKKTNVKPHSSTETKSALKKPASIEKKSTLKSNVNAKTEKKSALKKPANAKPANTKTEKKSALKKPANAKPANKTIEKKSALKKPANTKPAITEKKSALKKPAITEKKSALKKPASTEKKSALKKPEIKKPVNATPKKLLKSIEPHNRINNNIETRAKYIRNKLQQKQKSILKNPGIGIAI